MHLRVEEAPPKQRCIMQHQITQVHSAPSATQECVVVRLARLAHDMPSAPARLKPVLGVVIAAYFLRSLYGVVQPRWPEKRIQQAGLRQLESTPDGAWKLGWHSAVASNM